MKPNEQPLDHKQCSVCQLPYGFIRCRVTLRSAGGTRNVCLKCAVIEEKSLAAKLGVDNH